MLVYLKQPMGIFELEGKKLYGKFYNYGRMGPTKVTQEYYYRNKEYLEPLYYDSEVIGKLFGRECSYFTPFIYSNMSEVSEEELRNLAVYLDIDYDGIINNVYEKPTVKIWQIKTLITNKLEAATT